MEEPTYSGRILTCSKTSDFRQSISLDSKVLGQGSYGVVRSGIRLSDEALVAIKQVVKRKLRSSTSLAAEVEFLKECEHNNIIKLLDVYESNTSVYLVTELCSGGEVYERIAKRGRLSETEANSLAAQMVRAVRHMHSRGVVHRDLKPENFLYSSKASVQIKLADFGFAKRFDGRLLTEKVGTSYYVAPEVLRGSYTSSCDLWSLGAIAYAMLVGYPPYEGENDSEIMAKIQAEEVSFEGKEWNIISASAIDYVSRLLDRNPLTRMTAAEAEAHPWLKRQDSSSEYVEECILASVRRLSWSISSTFIYRHGLDTYLELTGLNECTMDAEANLMLQYSSQAEHMSSAKLCKALGLTIPGQKSYNQQVLRLFESFEHLDTVHFLNLLQASTSRSPGELAIQLKRVLDEV